MNTEKNSKTELIFKEDTDGKLQFVGDFDGLYAIDMNPWEQSADSDLNYNKYYDFSRARLAEAIKNIENKKTILEVGCGKGFALNLLADNLPDSSLSGVDISSIAIEHARKKFPNHNYMVGDIGSSEFAAEQKYDIVIFNQILWYILENIETAVFNAHKLLRLGGHFLISQGYLKEQHYGLDIVDGFDGCREFMEIHHKQLFSQTDSQFDHSGEFLLNDGLLSYQKLLL
jgi:SAM-dependent methyltransferase